MLLSLNILNYLCCILHLALCYVGEHNINALIICFNVNWAYDLDDQKFTSGV